MKRKWIAAALALAVAAPAFAQQQGSVEQRLTRVEKLMESRGLLDLFVKVEQLQREVRQLRGLVEEQNHRIGEMETRQRNLYADIDRRLRRVEVGGAAAAPVAATTDAVPAAGGAPAAVAATPSAAAPAPVDSAPAGEERAAYEKALDYLREGRYAPAMEAFRAFLAAHPQSGYADNAQYWLGEANYVTRNFDAALEEFAKVVANYPDSSKVPDALLKTGFVHYEKGEWAAARESLEAVKSGHPRSTAARLAEQRLQKMKAEGH